MASFQSHQNRPRGKKPKGKGAKPKTVKKVQLNVLADPIAQRIRRQPQNQKKGQKPQSLPWNPKNPAGLDTTSKFLMNVADPTDPFLIPRLIPTHAVPVNFRSVKTLNPSPTKRWAIYMVQPSFTTPIVELEQTTAAIAYTGVRSESYHHLQRASAGQTIDFDNELKNGSGARITPTAIPDGNHYGENLQWVEVGGKKYAGSPSTLPANQYYLTVHNRGGMPITVQTGLQGTRGKTRSPIAITWGTPTNINAGATAGVACGAYTNSPLDDGACICFKWNWIDPLITNDASLDIQFNGFVELGGSYHWKPHTMLPTGGDYNDAMSNFRRATGVSTTGFSCLMQNTANLMNRGGTISACRLTGGSRYEIPGDPQSIQEFIANKTGTDIIPSAQLSDGLFWWYHPEKIQDIMFRPHADNENSFLYSDKNLPYIVISCTWNVDDSAPNLTFTLKMNMEYITNSIVVPKFRSPMDTSRLIELWLSLGADQDHLSCNPEHIANIKNWIGKVVKNTLGNPEFRSAALSFGAKLAPLLLV